MTTTTTYNHEIDFQGVIDAWINRIHVKNTLEKYSITPQIYYDIVNNAKKNGITRLDKVKIYNENLSNAIKSTKNKQQELINKINKLNDQNEYKKDLSFYIANYDVLKNNTDMNALSKEDKKTAKKILNTQREHIDDCKHVYYMKFDKRFIYTPPPEYIEELELKYKHGIDSDYIRDYENKNNDTEEQA
jgi:hypothetical protein